MVRDTPRRRLFRLLRRATQVARLQAGSGEAEADENAIWLAHQRALNVVREGAESTQKIASSAAKQRGTIDAIGDRTRSSASRAQEMSAAFTRIVDSFDRLSLVALNAGLEGARLGETVGRSLALVGDEVRAQTSRGWESARELSTTLSEIGGELAHLNTQLDQVREMGADVAHEAARASAAGAEADRVLVEMSNGLRRTTNRDPETVMAIAEAAEHARQLVTALGSLGERVPRALILSALRPMLEPLARILADDDSPEDLQPEKQPEKLGGRSRPGESGG
jgi:methyl-accepting chemotaxis protein